MLGKNGRRGWNKKTMIKIGNKEIGKIPYVIAEFGANSDASVVRAKEAIDAAVNANCDAIKFQTYTADELVVKGTPKFWSFSKDDNSDQHQAYNNIKMLSYDQYPELIAYCKEKGIEFLSTPFSIKAADFLNSLGMAAFKIASSDMSTIPFLKHVARYGKPILLSTGASTMEEIHEAVQAIEEEGNTQIVIMHCTLKYPTAPFDSELGIITQLRQEFPNYLIGLSDHSREYTQSMLAVAAGACLLEKHFTTDNNLTDTADHDFALNPDTMKWYVEYAHKTANIMGSYEKKVFDCESETRIYDKRSLVSAVDIKEGDTITSDMLTWKRPGTGIWPRHFNEVVGMKANGNIPADTTLHWAMFQ